MFTITEVHKIVRIPKTNQDNPNLQNASEAKHHQLHFCITNTTYFLFFRKSFHKPFVCFKKHELSRKRLGLYIQIFSLAGIESPSQRPYKVWHDLFGQFWNYSDFKFLRKPVDFKKLCSLQFTKPQQSHIEVWPCVQSLSYDRRLCFEICLLCVLRL